MGKQTRPKLYKQGRVFITNIDEAQGVVEAVVNVFGIVDDHRDMVMPGAFVKTLTESKRNLRVLDSHNVDSIERVIGIPLALAEVGRDGLPAEVLAQYPEATGGLWTKTQYLLDTPQGMGAFRRIAAGAIDEYSIGFSIVKSDIEKLMLDGKAVPVRLLREIALWEYSPVIWGANPATATVGVKSPPLEPILDDAVEEDTLPLEVKGGGTLGATLTAAVATETRYLLAWWLESQTIDLDEYNLLTGLLVEAARGVNAGLPEALRDRPLGYDVWAGDAPDGTKAGRVLSARNYERIRTAHDALVDVMSSAGMAADNENADADAAKAARDAERTQAAEPGTDAPLTAAQIQREIDELAALMKGTP